LSLAEMIRFGGNLDMIQNQEVLRGIFTISRIVAIVQILLMTPKVTDEL